ncbi:MAG: prolipoprotein diacylglyceryl transferase [Thiogranum sp.]|jgi:phosphatidylglycerol:prolipoprotein diacylglycerol transferase|nr:prolipoprotein diacylglyceryl transferase [Thiogranum sp.]
MLTYPDISPVAISLGPLAIHWYGLTYLVGFIGVWVLGGVRARKPDSGWKAEEIPDMLFYGALGVILGGRIGYMFFYHFDLLLDDPLVLFRIWQGGMSFHGGMLGVFIAMWLYGRKTGRGFFEVTDFMAPFVPIGLGAGRIGNFINGELWGRPTDLPWGMVFPFVDNQPRHPSMLYEAFFEGLVLFIILWLYSSRPRPTRAVSGMFMLGYGVFRFGVEFVRQPDAHIGYIAFGWLTEGQILSAPMILFGVYLLVVAYRSGEKRDAGRFPPAPRNKGSQ